MGPPVLADHRRIFHRTTCGAGVADAGCLVGVGVLSVRLTVLISYQSNDMFSALQTAFEGTAMGSEKIKHSGIHGFWISLVHFSVLASLFIFRLLIDIYLTQRFIIAWRMWLTGQLTDDWLDGQGLLPGPVHRRNHRQPRPAHPAGHRHLHRRRRWHTEHPVQRDSEHLVVRCSASGGVGGVVRRDLVAPVGAAGRLRLRSSRTRCSGSS